MTADDFTVQDAQAFLSWMSDDTLIKVHDALVQEQMDYRRDHPDEWDDDDDASSQLQEFVLHTLTARAVYDGPAEDDGWMHPLYNANYDTSLWGVGAT